MSSLGFELQKVLCVTP